MTCKHLIFLTGATLLLSSPALAQDMAAHHEDMTHADMDHSKMDHSKMNHSDMSHTKTDKSVMDHSKMDHSNHDHDMSDMNDMADPSVMPADGVTIVTAKVNGLVCDFCAQALKKVFGKEDAVDTLDVDLDAGEVRIALKDGQTIADEKVKDLIRKSGYSLVSLSRNMSE